MASGVESIAIIGGGISGLAAAHRITEIAPQCKLTLFEASDRLGGVVSTVRRDGFQVERSSDNFITTSPWGVDLCKRLGLGDQLISTNPTYRRTFVVRRGRLHHLPDGFLMMAPTRLWPLALTPILSPLGKMRAALEYFIPPRGDETDESMAQFARRRLGREAFERLIEPLVSAVYAADMEKLSVLATLSRFREMEREHGSLIRAMRSQMHQRPQHATESGARFSMFVTLRDGLQSMIDALTARLPTDGVRLRSPALDVRQEGDGWRVHFVKPSGDTSTERFDAVIVSAPSSAAAQILRPTDERLGYDLALIRHSGTAIVSLGYDDALIGHPMNGIGAVVPAVENSPILAISFSTRKYAHRAPAGKTLIRVFVGGARRPELAETADDELLPLVREPLERWLRIRGEPVFCDVAHWPRTMPQYHVGHKELVARIEAAVEKLPRLALAGNAYHGVGLPDCIRGGELAAEKLLGNP